MAMRCEICGKQGRSGNKVSHSNRKTRRTWKPNIQKVLVEYQGVIKRMRICTKCLKTKVKRPLKKVEIT
ncbi:MAG: 50S ribosomal protein L28 [Candidatus Omnitrophica bacterium]|nr:50S ribosomal protein L28 [Candidatus Omnitrophota bacterium]MCM8809129.1 50S ribosomal protein L28 [Candidatus Omnitrophota bacterium]MCM8832500.1 50S ribosomal protein L28 [Candidatus Omnitrophota bacterium]